MLIFPPMTFSRQVIKQSPPPLGIGYLATVLCDEVYIRVLDASDEGYDHEEKVGQNLMRYGLSFSGIEKRIRELPDLIGVVYIFSSEFRNTGEAVKAVKRVFPNFNTITGGTHSTFLPELSMERCPELDLIDRGEGENTILDLIQASRPLFSPIPDFFIKARDYIQYLHEKSQNPMLATVDCLLNKDNETCN